MIEDNESRNLKNNGSPKSDKFESKADILEAAERGCSKVFNVSLSTLKDAFDNAEKEVSVNLILTLALLADKDISLVRAPE